MIEIIEKMTEWTEIVIAKTEMPKRTEIVIVMTEKWLEWELFRIIFMIQKF